MSYTQDVIDPAQIDSGAPVASAPKMNGSIRFCVDYRKSNSLMHCNSYLITRMDECINSLKEATVFFTSNASSRCLRAEIVEEDKEKTSLTLHHGLCRYVRVQFGLLIAPGTFQRTIDVILNNVKWQYTLEHSEDKIMLSKAI